MFVPKASPILKELAPPWFFALLLRITDAVFPTKTVELGPTLLIFMLPIMETTNPLSFKITTSFYVDTRLGDTKQVIYPYHVTTRRENMSSDLTNLDWLRTDPFFKKHFPFEGIQEHLKMNSDEVDQYVENALREANMNPAFKGRTQSNKLQFEHLDTHHLLITKIRIPKRIHPENIWVQLNRTQIRIHGLGDEGNHQTIPLPTPINPDQSKATFKQGSLQIKMPKMATGRFKDIAIRYL